MSRRASDWMFYLAPDAWERYKLLDIHDDLKRSQSEVARARARATDSVETLEENLSRAMLLVHSLTEALVRKGLITREEISAVAAQLDLPGADGKRAGGAGTANDSERPISPEEFLSKLEKS